MVKDTTKDNIKIKSKDFGKLKYKDFEKLKHNDTIFVKMLKDIYNNDTMQASVSYKDFAKKL